MQVQHRHAARIYPLIAVWTFGNLALGSLNAQGGCNLIEQFGTLADGTAVTRVTLRGGGLTANLLDYGAVLQDLRLSGHAPTLVLGFPAFDNYLTKSPYFGALAGRCANRIRDGHVQIDGQTYQLDRNFLGKHMLHGGAASMGKSIWRFSDVTQNAATLSIQVPDGHMGFPGNLDVTIRVSLPGNGILDMNMQATTDAPTLCNLAHHSYFTLSDEPTILDHQLQINAEHYLPVDAELIPTGQIAPVAGTRFDFTHAAPVGQAKLVDHNYCLSTDRTALRKVARLSSAQSAVSMDISTTEAGLQVYDGAKISVDAPGLDGQMMGAFAGIALEPQSWPDANHHPGFPQSILRPGETYHQHSQFRFHKS